MSKASEYLSSLETPMEGKHGEVAIGTVDASSFDWHLANTFNAGTFKEIDSGPPKVSKASGIFRGKAVELFLLEFPDGSRILEMKR